ncbi:hypothetical protein SAMN04488033_11398 [Salegentibacter agarivorans]|uniref:Uncharacterized protein n=1 Tax=Salegentibacter agarivorans TaxID=345907 RepID=A0A1I2MNQ3_9FLAO|nr:hypothetical protein [Salegentibacter agarivorans]SFF90771.1 hypothetical protein SAMN04488033_11398 [Salegentibacter agarivorans]
MEDVALIYHNKLGIAFRWKNNLPNADPARVQMVFKDMGFYLLPEEFSIFPIIYKLLNIIIVVIVPLKNPVEIFC